MKNYFINVAVAAEFTVTHSIGQFAYTFEWDHIVSRQSHHECCPLNAQLSLIPRLNSFL